MKTTMRAVHTTFDRDAMPDNLLTVSDWMCLGRAWYGQRYVAGWSTVARRYANRYGGAMVMLADDTLVVFTRSHPTEDNGVSRRTYKPGTWSWAKDEVVV